MKKYHILAGHWSNVLEFKNREAAVVFLAELRKSLKSASHVAVEKNLEKEGWEYFGNQNHWWIALHTDLKAQIIFRTQMMEMISEKKRGENFDSKYYEALQKVEEQTAELIKLQRNRTSKELQLCTTA